MSTTTLRFGPRNHFHGFSDWIVAPDRPALTRWLVSLAVACIALAFQLTAWQHLASRHMVFLLAVIFVAWFGGRWAGLFVSVALTLALACWFMPPHRAVGIDGSLSWWVALGMFLALSSILTLLISMAHRALHQRLQAELALRSGHGELETRVRERTSELNQVNEQLEREVQERKRAEGLLKQQSEILARSNAELEQFAYVASHDLQEPLRMVSSFLQLLEQRCTDGLSPEGLEFIHYAVDGSKRMQMLINDLLAYSRVGSQGQPFGVVDCCAVVRAVLANLRTAIEQTNAVIEHSELPMVTGDETQLVQLFQNLLSNALKFRGEQAPHIRITATSVEGYWQFAVKDNGIGINPAYFGRIFLIFQRLHGRGKYEGTGIGLALCKKIVTRHGGKIWVESAPGQGATFCFTLPKAPGGDRAAE